MCAIHLQIFTRGHCRNRHGYTQRHGYATNTHRYLALSKVSRKLTRCNVMLTANKHFIYAKPVLFLFSCASRPLRWSTIPMVIFESILTTPCTYAPRTLHFRHSASECVDACPPASCSLSLAFSRMPARFLLPLPPALLGAPSRHISPCPPSPPTTLTPSSLDVAVFALLAATKPPPLLSPAASLAPSVGFLDSVDGHQVRVPRDRGSARAGRQPATDSERN